MKKYFLNFFPFLLIILLCIPLVIPFFKSGYFPTHDGEWAVVRLSDMFRTLKDLQFPTRFSGALNFGYGYPLFNFAYPFPYYLGVLIYAFSHSFILSIKTMFVLSVFLSGIFMYAASYELWKNRIAGVVSAILYIYLPYRMVDLYVRGSIGESLSFVLFPLILFFSLKLFEIPERRINVFFLALSVGILVMTHNIMTVLYLPVLTFFVVTRVIQEKKYEVLKPFFLGLFFGFGLSFFFWFPALYEKGNILLSVLPIADRNLYFVNLQQLFVPSWGYSPPTENGGFSYQLGIPQSIVILVSFIFIFIRFLKTRFLQPPAVKFAFTLFFIWVLCFLMLFSFSSIIWESTPFLKEINYPWVLLSQLGFLTALLSGFLVIQGKAFRSLLLILSLVSFFLVIPYAKPFSYNNYEDSYYLTNEATTTSSQELMPLWVREFPKERFSEKVEVVKGNAKVSDLFYKSNKIGFNYKAEEDSIVRVNTIYYPGWEAYLDGKKINISHINPKGVMDVEVEKSEGKIILIFKETSVRMISNIVSLIALALLLIILIRPVLFQRTK